MWSDPTKASSLNCDSDADEIVEEIPIYLSKHLQHLALYQFTSRKANDQLDRSHVVSSTVKPLNQEARLEFALDTRSSHYDAFKGDQFAIAADGQKAAGGNAAAASTGRTFPDGRMDRQAFVSTRPIENTDRFLVGMLHDKELHMTPLGGGILQMRPSFSYFDKSDVRNRAEKKAENDEDMEEAKQVTVQFARTENENVRKAREKSFGVVSQKGADEPWCETVYYARSTPEAALERNKLYSTILTDNNNLILTNNEYLEALIPARRKDTEYEKPLSNAFGSDDLDALLPARRKDAENEKPVLNVGEDKLKLDPLSDRIVTILKDGKVINFDLLIKLLDDPLLSADRVLQTLPSVGLLVQGNWTVLSEILYPEKSLSGTNGVPADLMCRARDYVLFKLSRSEPLDRPRVAIVTQIPADEVLEIMQSVARYEKSTGWQLLLAPDRQFEQNYTRHKERQEFYWRAKEAKFHELETADHVSGNAAAAASSTGSSSPPKRKRTKSMRSDGGGSSSRAVDVKQEK